MSNSQDLCQYDLTVIYQQMQQIQTYLGDTVAMKHQKAEHSDIFNSWFKVLKK